MWRNRIVRHVDAAESWKRAQKDFVTLGGERDSLREELAEAKRQQKLQQCELDRLSAALREVREFRDAVRAQDQAEAEARRERDEAIDQLNELRAIIDARQATEERLAELYRLREIARAKAAERPPGQLLH